MMLLQEQYMRQCKEVWKPVVGFENIYRVSNYGRVCSVDRTVSYIQKNQYGTTVSTKFIKGKILSPRILPNGRRRVQLNNRDYYIYRLVVEAFIRPLLENEEVNHIDGDKTNDCLYNLEICTRIENEDHAILNELNTYFNLSKAIVLNGKLYMSLGEAERDTGILKQTLSKALKHEINKYKGYKNDFTLFDFNKLTKEQQDEVISRTFHEKI